LTQKVVKVTLKERLNEDMKTAMKAREELRLSVLRLARASLVNAEIAKGTELDDAGVVEVLEKEAKKRRESIAEFTKAGRTDLADKEQKELEILTAYLPQQMSAEELRAVVRECIAEVGATSPKDMGAVMKVLMPKIRGRADGKAANQIVQEMLA
jgi:hypothetical protein